jgi:hypothetical protein
MSCPPAGRQHHRRCAQIADDFAAMPKSAFPAINQLRLLSSQLKFVDQLFLVPRTQDAELRLGARHLLPAARIIHRHT